MEEGITLPSYEYQFDIFQQTLTKKVLSTTEFLILLSNVYNMLSYRRETAMQGAL